MVPTKKAAEQRAGTAPYQSGCMPNSTMKINGDSNRKHIAPLKLVPASSEQDKNCALRRQARAPNEVLPIELTSVSPKVIHTKIHVPKPNNPVSAKEVRSR